MQGRKSRGIELAVADFVVGEGCAGCDGEGSETMLAAPLIARANDVVSIDSAAFRTNLLLPASPSQFRHIQTRLLIIQSRNGLQCERHGITF